ncbi:hypothetical protein TIFTF001_021913 [Ficus carica]|uniref:Amino acid transporter transmembrane domain-containing protein n=1 Tax=Ficus carica TaxID=3494 RepID=A0AA88AGS9_FICCA|nr:hypothetical protein TIFTF001_021913 [Ficus carica]
MEVSRTEKEDQIDEANIEKKLDAGALFVLKSRVLWIPLDNFLCSPRAAKPSVGIALARLVCRVDMSSCIISGHFLFLQLLSLVLKHHAQLGRHQLRFCKMAMDILGPGWGRYFVGPIQFGLCYGGVIACILLGGQSLKLIGHSKNAPEKVYSVSGTEQDCIFGSFNAISIIATTYGNGIIPEIHATIAAPVKGKMLKGLCVCFAVVITTLVLFMTNVFTLLQVSAVAVPCFLSFGDINAVIGAFGSIPLDFILPMIFYNVTFKPSKNILIFWGNMTIASIYSALGVLGAMSSIGLIVLDANKYSLFRDI